MILILGLFNFKSGAKAQNIKTISGISLISKTTNDTISHSLIRDIANNPEITSVKYYIDSQTEYEASDEFLYLNPTIDSKQIVVITLFLLEYLIDNKLIDTTNNNDDGIKKIKEYKLKKVDSYEIYIKECFQISPQFLTKDGNEFMKKCIGEKSICTYHQVIYDNLKDFEIINDCKLQTWFQNLYLIKYNTNNRKKAFELFEGIRTLNLIHCQR